MKQSQSETYPPQVLCPGCHTKRAPSEFKKSIHVFAHCVICRDRHPKLRKPIKE